MQVFRFNFRHQIDKKILYIHGGFNALQPSPFHWRLLDKITLSTLYEVVTAVSPKTPEFHIDDTFQAIQRVYDQLVSEVGHQNVVVMGDGCRWCTGIILCTISSIINSHYRINCI